MTEAVTSVLTVVTAFLVLATAVVTYRTRSDVKQVHILVNSKMTAALDRIDQLTAALRNSDTTVPEAPEELYGVEPEEMP